MAIVKQRRASLLVTLFAIVVVSVGLLNSVGGSRERGAWAAFPDPLEYGIWHTSRGYTGFHDCMDQHETPKMLAGGESNEGVKEWCRMATQPAID